MPLYFSTLSRTAPLTYVNTAFAAMTGQPPEALVGRPFFETISPADPEVVRVALAGLTPEWPVETHAVQPYAGRHPALAAMDEPGHLRRGRAARPAPGRRPRHHRFPRGRGGPPPGQPDADAPLGIYAARSRQPAPAVLRGYLSLARAEEASRAVAAFLQRSMAAAERIAT